MDHLSESGAIAGSKELWTFRADVAPPPRTAPPRPDGRASLSPDPASPAARDLRGCSSPFPRRASLRRRLRPRENAATLLRGARACLALLAAAALLALAAPAQAQTEVWTATLTPGDLNLSILGCSNGIDTARCSSTTVLSDDSFNYDSTDYTITKLFVRSGGYFELDFDADITTATAALTLVVGSTSLVLADADTITTRERIWHNSGVSLTEGADITVKLIAAASSNTAPTVASVIPDQPATVGTALSYAFPTNTFADTDAGDTLTYTATKSDDSALPLWLSFTAATRTFSGTPQAADLGTVSVKVTASDGTDSVSDTFDIVVSATADTTPPEVESVTVPISGAEVELVFDEDLDETVVGTLLVSVFSLTVAGQAVTIRDYEIRATVLALYVQAGTIKQGQTVVLSYTDPTAGDDTVALQDIAGNDVASFTTGMSGVPAVTNNSTVTANTAPTSADGYVEADEDTDYTFSSADFPFTDTAGDSLASVKVVTLPASGTGTLTLSGTTIGSGDLPKTVPAAEIDDLKYSPAANLYGTDVASFTFKVNDGTVDSDNAYTMNIDVKGEDDPATGKPGITGTAQVGERLTATAGTIADLDGLPDPFISAALTTIQWIQVDGATETDISGATNETYTLATADAGKKIKVKVSFEDEDGAAEGPLTSDAYPASGTVTAAFGTSSVLVSNVGQTYSPVGRLSLLDLAQSFTTGANATGYALTSIELRLNSISSTDTPTVKLFRVSATGTEVATFAGPAMLDADTTKIYTFTPSSTVTLLASTTYWVVAEGDTFWSATTSTSEDATSATGWSIADGYESRPASATGGFTATSGTIFQIRVNGTTVAAPNTPPTAANNTVTAGVGAAYTFEADHFGFADTDTGDTLASVKIVTPPALGALALDGTAVLANAVVSKAQIDGGMLKFTPAAGASSTAGYASFTFKVNDGRDDSADAYTMTIDVAVLPAITIAADRPTATGKLDWIHYTLNREGDTAAELTVTVILAGHADNDWGLSATKNSREVTFAADSATAEQSIRLTGHGFGHIGFSLSATTSGALTARLGATTGYDTSDTDEVAVVVTSGPAWVIKLAEDHYRFDEDGGDQNIELVATAASADMPAPSLDPSDNSVLNLSIITQQGTAEAHAEDNPGDFLAFSADPYFTSSTCSADPDAGNVQVCRLNVTFTPVDDGEEEPDETLELVLAQGLGAPPSIHFQGPGPDRTVSLSEKTYPITIVDDDFRVMGAATISGAPQVGQTLTAVTTGIRDPDGLTTANYMYQWILVDGGTEADISGANSSTYTLLAADLGKTIKVRVTFTDDASNAETRTSVATATVIAAPSATCGVPDFGSRRNIWTGALTVEAYSVNGVLVGHGFDSIVSVGALAPTTFHTGLNGYTVDGVGVPAGGTIDGDLQFGLTRDLTAAEVAALRLHVCDTTYDFSAANHDTSNSTYIWADDLDWSGETTLTLYLSLPANNPATGTPTITGTATVGQELTAATGAIADSDGLTTPGYTYQWIRVDADGTSNEEDISGEIAATYTLTDDDMGKKVKVKASFTDDLGGQEERTSAAYPSSGTVTVAGVTDVDEPPDAPATPSVTAVSGSTTSLTVSWAAPANAGKPPIAHYDVQYRAGTSGTWTNGPQDVTGTTTVITSLATDTAYQARVRAANAEGDSGWSDPPGSGRTDASSTTAPGEPASLTAREGDAQVTLSWTPPALDGGAPIEKYQYRHSAGATVASGARWMDAPDADSNGSLADERSVTVPDLVNGRQYAFEVRAVNSAAVNGPAARAVATPVRAPLPAGSGFLVSNFGKPADGSVQIYATRDIVGVFTTGARGAELHSIELRLFTRHTGVANIPSATLYRASVTDTRATRGARVAALTAVPGSPRPSATAQTVAFTAPGGARLEADATYLVLLEEYSQIRAESTTYPAEDAGGASGWAIDGIGTGNSSPYSYGTTASLLMRVNGTAAGVTVATAPDAPASLGAVAGDARVRLIWAPPRNDGGAGIEKYQYRYSAGSRVDPGTAWIDVPDGSDTGTSLANERSVSVTELDNGGQYAFELRAVNAVRAGAAATATATPAAPPRSGFLVSNFGQPADGAAQILTGSKDIVGVFTTGALGGTLDSIEFRLDSRTPEVAHLPSATLYRASVTGARATSGTRVATLTAAPGSPRPAASAQTIVFTAPGGARLDAGATYMVVLEGSSGYVGVQYTNASAQDAGGASGWTIDGVGAGNSSPYSYGTSDSLLMSVNGTIAATARQAVREKAAKDEQEEQDEQQEPEEPATSPDPDRGISLSTSSSSAIEGQAVTISVRRAGPTDRTTSVAVQVFDSALTGAWPIDLDFRSGVATATATVAIPFDGARPASRTVTVSLASVEEPYSVGSPSTLTFNVTDRDAALSVDDASVSEGPGATLAFAVTLDRTRDREVRVKYATSDGTATQGDDYTGVSGTLRFAPGETSKTVSVPVLDDAHDEGTETLVLRLSAARRAVIEDGEATGSISNSDPLPNAWLSRFGRTASDQVVQSIGRRLEGGPRESHLTVLGFRADTLFESAAPVGASPLDSSAPVGATHASPGQAAAPVGATHASPGQAAAPVGATHASPAQSLTGAFVRLPEESAPMQGSNRWLDLMGQMIMNFGPSAGGARPAPGLRDVVMGSSFHYDYTPEAGPLSGINRITTWGESASTRFGGAEGKLSLDGEVNTAIVGADAEWGRWLAGLALSYSEGAGGYRQNQAGSGALGSTLTAINPYARYRLDDRTSFWGTLGYGSGRLTLTPDAGKSSLETGLTNAGASPLETDLTNAMAAFGGRGVLSVRSGATGMFELALRSDAMFTDTASMAVAGLSAGAGATSRVRLILEGSGSMPAFGGVLSPRLEAGLRYDGGDAETGAGLEVGGGLAYDMARLTVQLDGRMLLTHQDRDYEEWGYSVSVAYQPGQDGRGVRYQAGSEWGATQSGVQSLWSLQNAGGLRNAPGAANGQRYTAEFGYGFGERRRWYPYVATESGGAASRSLRFGLKLNAGTDMEAGLEIGRREHMSGLAEDAILLNWSARW